MSDGPRREEDSFASLERQLSALSPVAGVTPVDLLQLPDRVGALMRKTMRAGLTPAQIASELRITEQEGQVVGLLLEQKGYLRRLATGPGEPAQEATFSVNFVPARSRRIPLDL